jgi:molecular chaperone DnaK
MAGRAIGIDLGTSNSCVATVTGSDVAVLPNAYGENTSASVVSFAEDGSITVGNAARANIIHDPEHTVSSAKRLIGRYFFSEEVKKAQAICSYEIIEGPNHGVRIQVREEAFSLPEISAMVLREMKQLAETRLGEEVREAVITVPAYFNDNQRQATKDAGKIAGLEVLRILNEPTAAALAYGFGKGLDQRVAVYDLGGGTFDISILEIGKDIFEVLSTCGDTFLGGDDFDDRIIDLVADEFVQQEGINIRNDPYAFEKLKMASEAAKRGLSVDEEVEIRIPDILVGEDGESRSIQRTITRNEFSSLITDLIQRTFKVCDEAMQQADLTVQELDGVILVGGPTRLAVIREAVQMYFQQDPKANVDPDEVVAMGAAIHANSLVNETAESFLLDVTPLDLRIGVAGGLAEPVIERNTPVPIEQSRMFTTFSDFQETVDIRVYQGDHRESAANELLGQFEFSGFKKAKRGEVSIEVTFEINADGIVSVRALDPETGAEAQTSITLSSGLSDEELASILEENPAARVQTVEGMPEPDEELGVLPDDDDLEPAVSAAVQEVPHIAPPAPMPTPGPAPDLAVPEADELEVLAEDLGDDLLDEAVMGSEPAVELVEEAGAEIGLEIDGADAEDESIDLQTMPILDSDEPAEVLDANAVDLNLDGRALTGLDPSDDDIELEIDEPGASPVAEAVATPTGEVVVELADDSEQIDLAPNDGAETAVVLEGEAPQELELMDEAVVELEPEETGDLFDHDNTNLSAGLDEDVSS